MSSITINTTKSSRGTKAAKAPKVRVEETVMTTRVNRKRRKKKNSDRKPLRLLEPNNLSAIKRMIEYPFDSPTVRLRTGIFGPTAVTTAFARFSITVGTGGYFLVGMLPQIKSGWFWSYVASSSTVYPTMTTGDMSNATSISSNFQNARVVAGAVRARYVCAATSVGGYVDGLLVYDSPMNIQNLTPQNFEALEDAYRFPSTHPSSVNGQVNYRPFDFGDLNLLGGTVNTTAPYSFASTTSSLPTPLIQINAPSAGRLDLEFVMHLEGTSGLDVGDAAEASSPGLSEQFLSALYSGTKHLFMDGVPAVMTHFGKGIANGVINRVLGATVPSTQSSSSSQQLRPPLTPPQSRRESYEYVQKR